MNEPEDLGKSEPDKRDPDILRLRAEARAVLQDPTRGRLLISEYVGVVRDAQGATLGPNLDFTRAKIGARAFERREGETLATFQARVISELPAVGVAVVAFLSDDEISL